MSYLPQTTALLLLLFTGLTHSAGQKIATVHLNERDIAWDDIGSPKASWAEEYKNKGDEGASLSEVIRLKTLVGHPDKGLADQDIKFGIMEIGPGAIYPAHQHPAPEIYYFVSGRAKWIVDNEVFMTEPRSVVYMKPNAVHQLEVVSDERLVVVWADWAPNGDQDTLNGAFKLLGQVPQQPERAKIARDRSPE